VVSRVARIGAAVLVLCAFLAAITPPGIFLDVPFVKQETEGCGAASIAMVMQYWDLHQGKPAAEAADAARIQQALYSKQGHGIYAADLENYFNQNGYRTFMFHGTWADLRQHLEKGRPLIVAVKPEGQSALHYVVVAGLEGEDNLVLINDPAQRKLLKQDRVNFEREWSAAGKWTLLALPQPAAR